jgi:hypothetical protein
LLRLKKNLNKYIKFIFYKLSILVGKFLLNIHNYIINFDIESCKCIIGGWWVYDKTSIGHYNSYILLINNTEYFKDNSIRNLFGYYKRLLSGKIDKKVFFYNCNTFSYGKNKVVFSLIEDLYFEKINLKLFFENYVKEYSKYNYKKVHSNVSNITSFVKNLNPLIKYYTHRTSSDENRILAKLFNLNNFPVIEYAHGICSNPYYWFPKRTNLLYVNNLLDYLHITNSSMGSLTTKISHFNGTKARIIKSKKYDLIYMICRHNGCFYGRNGDINKIDFHIYQKLKDVIKICNNSNLSLLIKLSPGHYPVQKIEISNILKKFCNYPYDLIQTEIDAPDCISMSRIGLTYNSGSAFDIMAQDIPCLVTNSCYDYFISVDLHKLPVLEDFDDLQNHIGMLLTDCEFYKSELIKQKKYYDVITNAI